MKGQWILIFGFTAALIIAIFAVINVEPVQVNYLFGTNEWPLILVIIGSVLMGGIIVGSVGIIKMFQLQLEIKRLRKQLQQEKASAVIEPEQQVTEIHEEEKEMTAQEDVFLEEENREQKNK